MSEKYAELKGSAGGDGMKSSPEATLAVSSIWAQIRSDDDGDDAARRLSHAWFSFADGKHYLLEHQSQGGIHEFVEFALFVCTRIDDWLRMVVLSVNIH